MGRFIKPEDWRPAGGIELEDSAASVVTSTESKSVIAGPGAGKTELLAQRALYLLQTGLCKPPQRILAISFKRDAAKNLSDRVARRCSTEQARRFDSYTFDAFAKSLVDRFLALTPDWCRPPRGYHILFPTRDNWNDFLRRVSPPPSLGGKGAAQALGLQHIERWGPLPLQADTSTDIVAWVAAEWWRESLSGRRPGASFPMIGRLAQAILSHNPLVLKALRLTYSHIFLDEFQDTTGSQYEMLKLAFGGSSAILTAVGDTKQRIMTWAGAEAEVFSWYEHDFRAVREKLRMNHRSNHRIVQIINDLVTEIEPDAVQTICARQEGGIDPDAAAFLVFETNESEAKFLANFVADDIEENKAAGRREDDFALIVRIRAEQMERQLKEAFALRGLRLRNEARSIDGIPIQDLMSDELASLLINVLRLSFGVRASDVYASVQETLGGIFGIDYESASDVKRLDAAIRNLIAIVRKQTKKPPAETDMDGIVGLLVKEIGEASVQRAFRQYENRVHLKNVQTALSKLMMESASSSNDWEQLVDAVEGKGQVRLMTIHKSKGLEYHTVIFVGLHQNAFFGYRNNRAEETNAFFVALSRARERVFFTWSKESGETSQIQGLIELLARAAIPFKEEG